MLCFPLSTSYNVQQSDNINVLCNLLRNPLQHTVCTVSHTKTFSVGVCARCLSRAWLREREENGLKQTTSLPADGLKDKHFKMAFLATRFTASGSVFILVVREGKALVSHPWLPSSATCWSSPLNSIWHLFVQRCPHYIPQAKYVSLWMCVCMWRSKHSCGCGGALWFRSDTQAAFFT